MNLSRELHSRIMETAIMELSSGKESAIQLRTLLQNPAEDGRVASLDQLMLHISRSFENTISMLSSRSTDKSAPIPAVGGGDGRGSACSDGGKRKAAAGRGRRGCYRRRRTSDSWITLRGKMEDGQAWRKYGQKIILNFDHPRCYFRCTHKSEGCKATKQVQWTVHTASSSRKTLLCKNTINSSAESVCMETKPTPECQCGNGLMILRKAGDQSTRPGEFYYICPAGLNHRNKFIWYDQYQGSNVIHKNSKSMEYTTGSCSGTKQTCMNDKGPSTEEHSFTQDCYPRKKESIAPTKEFDVQATDGKEVT